MTKMKFLWFNYLWVGPVNKPKLDLSGTPSGQTIMTTDVQHAVLLQRPVFKMNPATEFWQQQRGPNHMIMPDNPPSPSNDTTLLNNNNNTQCNSLNNNNTATANHMATNDSPMANNISSTSSGDTDQVMALSNNLVPEVHSTSPTPEPQNVSNALALTDPKLMTEKLVSELQVRFTRKISTISSVIHIMYIHNYNYRSWIYKIHISFLK